MSKKKWVTGLLFLGVILAAVLLASCAGQATEAPAEEEAAEEEAAEEEAEPTPEPEPTEDPAEVASALWAESAHADAEAEAFVHWDEEDPPEVPVTCAKCHSTPGHLDFLGEDGSAFGTVEAAAEIGTVITCDVCHNDTAEATTAVTFPSGVEITDIGPSARCMQCHQGRSWSGTVDEAVADLPVDTPNPDLAFINIHYFAAGATLYGSEVHAGYEYAGNAYQIRTSHVEGFRECIDCHDQHSLEVKVELCGQCHEGVASVDDLYNTRMNGSLADFDGDGDVAEGMYYELQGLQELLYQAIQSYAATKAGTAIVYDAATYPYFFIDTNANGAVDDGEAAFPNAYKSWTPRLLQAAYNYQYASKDPGAFAHNPKYVAALLYDSTASLNEVLAEPVDLSTASRNDAGHFDGTAEAFRHWDEEDPAEVPDPCSRCHSAEGLPTLLSDGSVVPQKPANGFACSTCHESLGPDWTLRQVAEVTFPSGASASFPDNPESNLCMVCHQGRESTVSVNERLAGLDPDTPNEELRFVNVHYFAAGATRFGGDAQGAYQYEGKTYRGFFPHVENFDACAECHNVHALRVKTEECAGCHGSEDLETFRMDRTDFDGDGDTDEGIIGEIVTMRDALYAAIQAYARTTAGAAIVYNGNRYPYFFADTNGNGAVDEGEEAYATWTPRLVQAAYNYQYSSKDPGAFAHNAKYIMQTLYDSIEDMGGDVSGMTRPE